MDLMKLVMFLMVFVLSPAPSGSVEEAQEAIVRRFDAIQSCSATVTTIETSPANERIPVKVEVKRRIEWVRRSKGFLYRSENTLTTTETHNGVPSSREGRATVVSDGVHVVTLAEQDGERAAFRKPADISVLPDMRLMFEELGKENHLKRMPDVKVGLRDCYAIQAIPKQPGESEIRYTTIYFAKDLGLDIRTIVYDKKNKPMYTSLTSDIRIDPEIPLDRFILVLPDGVTLQDRSDRR